MTGYQRSTVRFSTRSSREPDTTHIRGSSSRPIAGIDARSGFCERSTAARSSSIGLVGTDGGANGFSSADQSATLRDRSIRWLMFGPSSFSSFQITATSVTHKHAVSGHDLRRGIAAPKLKRVPLWDTAKQIIPTASQRPSTRPSNLSPAARRTRRTARCPRLGRVASAGRFRGSGTRWRRSPAWAASEPESCRRL